MEGIHEIPTVSKKPDGRPSDTNINIVTIYMFRSKNFNERKINN